MIFVNKSSFTSDEKKLQESAEKWSKDIESVLPVDLEQSAKEYGALQRKRGIKSASELLGMLMMYATGKISARVLSMAAVALKISTISDISWSKRLLLSGAWIEFLLNSVLSEVAKPTEETLIKGRNIYLIDGSHITQDGKDKRLYRIHMNYCLNTSCMSEVKVTDVHTSEKLSNYDIE